MSGDYTPPRVDVTVTGAVSREAASEEPARIGRFLVIGPLGSGGMGVVMAAYDPELDRRVALKLIRPEREGAIAQSRMLREAQAMARLSHPNVVQIYDVGVFGEQTYLAMELVEGSTIREWLKATPRSWREILAAFAAAGRGLAAAHEHGIVHRDFKPDNVLVSEDGRVRVADFGIAGWSGDTTDQGSEHAVAHSFLRQPLTSTGALVGTPRYMAPEQHAGAPTGPKADQFSYCVALHEALFGGPPFAGETVPEIVAEIEAGRVQAHDGGPRVPGWLNRLILKGLARDPEDRHPSVLALVDALDRYPRKRRQQWRLAAVGAAVIGAVGVPRFLTGTDQAKPCSAGAERIAEGWTSRRMDVEQATDEVVLTSLDEYAERWQQAEHEMCIAHQQGSVSAPLLDAAMSCLDRRYAALNAAVELALEPEAESSVMAEVTAKLPDLLTCTDRDGLRRLAPPPEDRDAAAAVASIRGALGEVEVLHNAGRIDEALEALAGLTRSADNVGHEPLRAEVALVAGRLGMDRGDWELAGAQLLDATHRGVASGMDAVAAEALARLIFTVGISKENPSEALEYEPWAKALIERLDGPPGLAALLANNVGTVYATRGQRDEATQAFTRAVGLAERAAGVNAIDVSSYLANLAMNTRDADERSALFGRSNEILQTRLGPAHLERLDGVIRWAQFTEDPRESLDRIQPVCSQLADRAHDDPMRCFLCNFWATELRDRLGQASHASESLDAALSCLEPGRGANTPAAYLQTFRDRALAYQALLDGTPAEALEPLVRAEGTLRPKADLPWVAYDLADVTLLRERAHQALGQPVSVDALREAIAVYEQRIAMNEDQAPRYRRRMALELIDQVDQSQAQSSSPL